MNYSLLIVYSTNRIAKIEGVQDYGFIDAARMFYFVRNNVRSFVPPEHVIYFGNAEDWRSV